MVLLASAMVVCALPGPASAFEIIEDPRASMFDDVTLEAGISDMSVGRSWGAAWADYNNDSWPDLFVGRHTGRALLLSNMGGSFAPVETDEDILEPFDRHACAWGEANGDARPDLFCSRGAQRGQGQGPNKLWIQTDEGFEERAGALGVQDPFGRGRSVNWLDYDTDGDLDLFVGNKHRDRHPNAMFRNDEDTFRRVRVGVDDELDSISSSWADWDNDRDPDLLVLQYGSARPVAYENQSGIFHRARFQKLTGRAWKSAVWGDFNGDGWPDVHLIKERRSIILKNTGGSFRVHHSVRLQAGRTSAWLDVDNDGDLDAFVVQGARGEGVNVGENLGDFLLVNRGGEAFAARRSGSFRGPRTGNGDSAAVADYNRDGRVDLLVSNGFGQQLGPLTLLRNRRTMGNWAELDLHGPATNPWGMGARIKVRTPGESYSRQITDGFTYRSQSEIGFVHLGLGTATKVLIKVKWPNGVTDCVRVSAGVTSDVFAGTHRCHGNDDDLVAVRIPS